MALSALFACGSSDDGPSESPALAGAGGAAGTTTDVAGGAGTAPDPGHKEIHRLNGAEYNATVTDVLGTALEPADAHWREGELAGFDNMASVLGVDDAQYGRYFDAAKTLAAEVFASEALRARFVACEPSDASCADASIRTAGLRLFRRPLTTDELETYRRVQATALSLGDTPLAGLELAFQAMLASAEFIYRIEYDPDPLSLDAHPLSAFELASRLSYFLWSSAPDDVLLQAAASGSLSEPSALSAEVDRMLDDPRSQRFITNFAGQWLGARRVLAHPVAQSLFHWSPDVARAARDEMLLFFSEFLRSERSWFEFPTADVNFVEEWLSAFYGMPTYKATTRVEYASDTRAGFFGLAGFLTLSSFDRRTSPSLRGRFISSNLLCEEPPEPPPDVPELDDGSVDPSQLNVRQILERHRQPACAGCHALFDPYGLALEAFDAIGQPRTVYADGTPVDTTATLPPSDAHPEGLAFTGLQGLSQVVASDPRFGECLAEKLLTYGLGRPVTTSDAPALQSALGEWLAPGSTPTIRRLLHALVATDAFRFRRGEGPTESP